MDRSSPLAHPPHDRARQTVQTAGLGLATALACLALGSVAEAQTQAPPTGSRYLSWANRTTSTTPPRMTTAARSDILPRRVAPSQGLARPQMQPFNPPLPISEGGLTPASAWIGPRVAPSFAPGNPDPLAYATTELAAAPPPPPPPPVMSAPVRTVPVAPPAPVAQPVYAPATTPTTAPAMAPSMTSAADPMAPRPDAPIFRLRPQGTAPTTAPTEAAPSTSAPVAPVQQTPVQQAPVQQAPVQTSATGQAPARYYSVHREAGRQPDPTVMPDPVFFDSVALDLAEPPEFEPPRRDAQGRRIPVANADPSLP